MEIWIRSQDRRTLINVNKIQIADFRDMYKNAIWGNDVLLGKYSTRQKALKVIDMIENFINSLDKYVIENDNYSGMPSLRKVADNNVFQMPSEDGVK